MAVDDKNHKTTDVKIKMEDRSWDMAPYVRSKMRQGLAWLADAVDILRTRPNIDWNTDEELRIRMRDGLDFITRAYSVVEGAAATQQDCRAIADEGREGFERMLVNFGLMEETTAQRACREASEARQERAQFVMDLPGLLAGGRSNRSTIQSRLSMLPADLSGVKEMRDLTEERLMGNLEWDEYSRGMMATAESMREDD